MKLGNNYLFICLIYKIKIKHKEHGKTLVLVAIQFATNVQPKF